MRFALILGVVATIAAAPFQAEARGWTIIDLGTVSSGEKCRDVGTELFNRQGSTLQIDNAGRHVAAYGLQDIDVDGSIGCSINSDGSAGVILMLHSWTFDDGTDERRLEMARELQDLWDTLPK